jgi:hypothetical protein
LINWLPWEYQSADQRLRQELPFDGVDGHPVRAAGICQCAVMRRESGMPKFLTAHYW